MSNLKIKIYSTLIFILSFANIYAQQQLLIPYRIGDLWGLSDINGNIKVKPIYNYLEPIGSDFYKFTYSNTVKDTIKYYNGYIEINDKIIRKTGVLKGVKEIIPASEHRHFTYAPQGLLIGSEESYISKNSNFYTVKGVKLLNENVEKFRFLGNNEDVSPFITIFLEHYDKTFSMMIFDSQLQKWEVPLFEHVRDFTFDRDASDENKWVCTYVDAQNNYHNSVILYDRTKKKHYIKPYTKEYYNYDPRFNDIAIPEEPNAISGYGTGNIVIEQLETTESDWIVEDMPTKEKPLPPVKVEIPKYFQKVNDSTAIYGSNTFHLAEDEKIFFPDYYTKTLNQPLIYQKNNRFGLQITDSLRSVETYDTLRYVKNQYGIFTFSHNFVYLVGNKQNNNTWLMGIIDPKGKEIIPMQYNYLSPNLPDIYLKDNPQNKKEEFRFRQPYNYYDDKKQLLTLYRKGFWVAEQNGKMGLINAENKIILPFEYDKIWHNDLSFLKTMRVNNDFNVYQKGEKYGVFQLDDTGKITEDTGAVFNKIPVYVYRNYLGQKGFDLYNLATPDDLYFCLASKDGKIYYKE